MADKSSPELLAVLNEERQMIQKGQFALLDDIVEKKAACFEQLDDQDIDPAVLKEIHTQLAENQGLLSAAIAGVAAARERLAALQHVRENLSVYDHNGQMATVATPATVMHKKV